jgi:hypothetical protein
VAHPRPIALASAHALSNGFMHRRYAGAICPGIALAAAGARNAREIF